MTTEFVFGTDVIDRVAKEIENTKKAVRMAIFQIHSEQIYNALNTALRNGAKVDVITLPKDSIKQKIRTTISERIDSIVKSGANVYYSLWGIGDPTETRMAEGRWYSYHGKFIVTDSSAIALSANFTSESELDVMLRYTDKTKISEFNGKFDKLYSLFVEGKIRDLIMSSKYKKKADLFEAPDVIREPDVKSHWITSYPVDILGNGSSLANTLYISPIEIRARELYQESMENAQEFVYISTESFTDEEIVLFLIQNALAKKRIKILTGGKSRDFGDRIQSMYPKLLANNIELRRPTGTLADKLHAKMMITDKQVIVSSVNLNKMNLGTAKSRLLWKANTETIAIENDPIILKLAKEEFEEYWNQSSPLVDALADKELDYASTIFEIYGIKTDENVKRLMGKLIVLSDMKIKKSLSRIGFYAYLLVNHFKRHSLVNSDDFFEAVILNLLTESKRLASDLDEDLKQISDGVDTGKLIAELTNLKLIEKDNGFLKINGEKLLGN